MKRQSMQPSEILHSIMMCIEECHEDHTMTKIRVRRGRPSSRIVDLDDLMEDENEFEMGTPEDQPQDEQKAKNSSKKLKQYVKMLITHPQFSDYALSENDALTVAYMWKCMLHNSHGATWKAALSWCKLAQEDVMGRLEYLGSLLDRGIVYNTDDDVADYHLNLYSLTDGSFRLHSGLSCRLQKTNPGEVIDTTLSPVWNERIQMDRDLILARHILLTSHPELEDIHNETLMCNRNLAESLLLPIKKRIEQSADAIPLVKLVREYKPDDADLTALLWTYTDYLKQENSNLSYLTNLISRDYPDRLNLMSYFATSPTIKEMGMFVDRTGRYRRETGNLAFTESTLHSLGLQSEDEDIDIFESSCYNLTEVKVLQSFDDLILPRDDKRILETVVNRYAVNAEKTLSDWGVCNPMTSDEKSVIKGTCILLYGAPGTGKTFSVGAIASALGRKLMAIDASQLRRKYYGESEKVLRKTFGEMRKLVAESETPPIFLLNEADQIVHKRTRESFSCSDVENALQNIFLEELETFPGLLILTTNLVDNIDDAYFRRFDVKIELHRPDYECRLKLWKMHLPTTIPGASEIDCDYLARTFLLSGGQIKLVVGNACNEAVTRQGAEKRLTMSDLERYAAMEDPWGQEEEKKNRIGFCA